MAIAESVPGPGYRILHYSMLLIAAAAFVIAAAAVGWGIRERLRPDSRITKVYAVSDQSSVSGASSTLTRNDDGVDYAFDSSGLPTGHVVTLRAEIFNHPEKCTHPERSMRCGAGDLQDPAVGGSVVFLSGQWLRQGTAVHLKGTISKDDKGRAIVGEGLTEPKKADVHLIILDHGTPQSGLYSDMLQTLGGGCSDPPFGSGAPGPIQCMDVQYSSHQ